MVAITLQAAEKQTENQAKAAEAIKLLRTDIDGFIAYIRDLDNAQLDYIRQRLASTTDALKISGHAIVVNECKAREYRVQVKNDQLRSECWQASTSFTVQHQGPNDALAIRSLGYYFEVRFKPLTAEEIRVARDLILQSELSAFLLPPPEEDDDAGHG